MNIEHKIQVMYAYKLGEEIEQAPILSSNYTHNPNPSWNWAKYDYRTKTAYPAYFEAANGNVAKFISLEKGYLVQQTGKLVSNPILFDLIPHTNQTFWKPYIGDL